MMEVMTMNTNMTDNRLTDALCAEIHLNAEGQVPEWVHLLPLGPEIRGRDGRAWTMPDPEAFVRASREELPAPFDYMHASEHVRPDGTGEEAPAAGWIVDLNVVREGDGRAPGIWGRVEWTPRGKKAIAAREYRFISPAFRHSSSGEIVRLTSAGLVHRPNLDLTALNAHNQAMTEGQRQALCLQLGLPSSSTHEEMVARVEHLQAAHRAMQARGEVVPRTDLESAIARFESAEERLHELAPPAFNAHASAPRAFIPGDAWITDRDEDEDERAFNAHGRDTSDSEREDWWTFVSPGAPRQGRVR